MPGDGGKNTPTIVVYGFEDAVAALRAAAWLRRPVRLKSPFAVSASLGPQVAWSMFRQASRDVPEAEATWVLDCGDDPGTALAALKAGVPEVQVALPRETTTRLAEIAEQHGARVTDADGPPVLDLADVEDSLSTCRQWLQGLSKRLDCSRKSHCQC